MINKVYVYSTQSKLETKGGDQRWTLVRILLWVLR